MRRLAWSRPRRRPILGSELSCTSRRRHRWCIASYAMPGDLAVWACCCCSTRRRSATRWSRGCRRSSRLRRVAADAIRTGPTPIWRRSSAGAVLLGGASLALFWRMWRNSAAKGRRRAARLRNPSELSARRARSASWPTISPAAESWPTTSTPPQALRDAAEGPAASRSRRSRPSSGWRSSPSAPSPAARARCSTPWPAATRSPPTSSAARPTPAAKSPGPAPTASCSSTRRAWPKSAAKPGPPLAAAAAKNADLVLLVVDGPLKAYEVELAEMLLADGEAAARLPQQGGLVRRRPRNASSLGQIAEQLPGRRPGRRRRRARRRRHAAARARAARRPRGARAGRSRRPTCGRSPSGCSQVRPPRRPRSAAGQPAAAVARAGRRRQAAGPQAPRRAGRPDHHPLHVGQRSWTSSGATSICSACGSPIAWRSATRSPRTAPAWRFPRSCCSRWSRTRCGTGRRRGRACATWRSAPAPTAAGCACGSPTTASACRATSTSTRHAGTGLSNTRSRLAQLYGAAATFEVRAGKAAGTIVEIAFPASTPLTVPAAAT